MTQPQPVPPAAAVDRFLPPGWDPTNHLAILAGGDCAPVALELLRRGQERLVVWLPDGADGADLPRGATAVRGAHELRLAILHTPGDAPRNAVVQRLGDPRVDRPVLEEIARVLKESVRARQLHQSTTDQVGPTWARNGLANLAALAEEPAVAALDGAFAGKPCVLVSPGPSLDRNVAQLAALRDHALIVASTHALAPLRAAGVKPHLVVAADPSPFTARHLADATAEDLDALVVAATCDPNLRAATAHLPTFSFAGNCAADAWLYDAVGEENELDTGGSVACSALSLAARLGCDQLVLVGQDLALDGDRYYAGGCVDAPTTLELDEERGTIRQAKRLPTGADGALEEHRGKVDATLVVPGWGGGEVRTTRVFDGFRGWFATRANDLSHHVRVVNATEGGAHIDGMEHLPLAEVAAGWTAPCDAADRIAALHRGLDRPARRAAYRSITHAWLASLSRAELLGRACDDLAKRALRRPDLLAKLQKKERELSATLRPVVFLSLLAQREIREAQRDGRAAGDPARSLEASRRLHAVVVRAAKELAPAVTRARDALRAEAAA